MFIIVLDWRNILKSIKKILSILLIFTLLLTTACVKEQRRKMYANISPKDLYIDQDNININFVMVHNDVLTSMLKEDTPFFYIKDNSFDISGSNDPNVIYITADALEGTTKADIDLFLSMALTYIGFACSEQNNKYKTPSIDETGTYLDFGSVYNEYDLSIKITIEGKDYLVNEYIKAGKKIPVDSRYWMNLE